MADIKSKPAIEHTKLEASDFKDGIEGYAEDMSDEDVKGKVVDSETHLVFADKASYLAYTSPISGKKPTDIDYLPAYFIKISEAALARGAARKAAKE